MSELILELLTEFLDIKQQCKLKMTNKYLNNYITEYFITDQFIDDNTIQLTTKNIFYKSIKKCVICNRKRTGEYTSFGLYSHRSCQRKFLINVYYTPNYISENYILDRIPFTSLLGYMQHTREQYYYNVVWKEKSPTLIKNKYTLEYLLDTDNFIIENRIKHNNAEKKRILEQEQKIQEEREKRQQREFILLKKRQKALDKRISKFTKVEILDYVNDETVIYGDFYDIKCVTNTKLKDVKENIKLIKKLKEQNFTFTFKLRSLVEQFFRTKEISIETLIENIILYNKLGFQLKNVIILNKHFKDLQTYKDTINLAECKLDKNFTLKLNRLKNLPKNCKILDYVLTGKIIPQKN